MRHANDPCASTYQIDMLNSEEEIRRALEIALFECGDGAVVRRSAMTFNDVEEECTRAEKNMKAVVIAYEQKIIVRDSIRPFMVDLGMSHVDAVAAFWRDRH